MRILLSNDDGYFSPGIEHLARALSALAEITVVAPERDRSGASNSLTLDRPLRLKQAANGFYYVNGTPCDCVHLAVTGVFDALPDMVVSGINNGANLGDDTLYSGTVAAATEGFLLGVPSVAVSLCSKVAVHYETAARVALEVVQRMIGKKAPGEPALLNINIPDVPYAELEGCVATRLGRRGQAESVVRTMTPRDETVFWVGAAGKARDAREGTDFHAIANKRVSITPLQVDMTHDAQIATLQSWMQEG